MRSNLGNVIFDGDYNAYDVFSGVDLVSEQSMGEIDGHFRIRILAMFDLLSVEWRIKCILNIAPNSLNLTFTVSI